MNLETMPPDAGQAPGLWADLCAKLDLHIGSTTKLLRQLEKNAKRPPAQPSFIRVSGTAIASASGLAVISFNLKGPDQGHFWYVRSLAVGGLTPTTTASGRADVYVTASTNAAATLAGLGLSDWRDFTATLPSVAFYSRGEMPLRLNEDLIVMLSSATSGQQYVAAAQVEDFEESAAAQTWDM